MEFITVWAGRSVYFLLPFIFGLGALFVLSKLAPLLGLVDRPNDRKSHTGNIPLVGGPAIFFALAAAASLLVPQFQVKVFLILCLILLALGVADDRLDLPALFRLIIQAAIATGMILFADLRIESLGNVLGFGAVEFSNTASVFFTIVCTIGVINSINMIDGLDGLAGTVLTISFGAMAILAWGTDLVAAKLLVIFTGAICAFLTLNSRVFLAKARVFMGDSGSMLLGFILVWFFIRLSQSETAPILPVVAGWIFGLPLLDTTVVMVRRMLSGKSPFTAGREHFHHRLLDSGLSVSQTVLVVSIIHSMFVVVGLLANNNTTYEPLLFWGFVGLVLFHYTCTEYILKASLSRFKDSSNTLPRT